MKKGKRVDIIIGTLGIAVGIVFFIIGKSYASFSADGGYTTASTWPTILSFAMIGLSTLLVVYTLFRKNLPHTDLDVKSKEFRGVLLMILALIAYFLSFKYLGCLITNAIFLPVLLYYFGERNWKYIVIYDIGALALIYVLFELVLKSRLAPPFFM